MKISKNPDLDTSFLPDRERDLKENELKDKLVKEFHEMQDKKKSIL